MNSMRKHVVFLTGAGMSVESGLQTFRGAGGLWEGHRLEEVAIPLAWEANPEQVTRFYNERRQKLLEAVPNRGHLAIAELESIPGLEVSIITQNIDDLHERAGSTRILHLHGELRKSRSTGPSEAVFPIEGWELTSADRCPEGDRLRPHVVWFGESVPAMDVAWEWMQRATDVVVVGTSLLVYPAAGLVHAAPADARVYAIDPAAEELPMSAGERWAMPASEGCERLLKVWQSGADARHP
jgi:NAD-dependent deacetylase